ncbi:MAG: VCBS repeat-containing protein, partial [Balneolaceae bacterium]|nr:VCBS repeat-containing protein [Balneolaceae bacterium]
MNIRLPKRKRKIVYTSALLIVFLTSVIAWVWADRAEEENLERDDNSEITSRLSRGLPDDMPEIQFENVTRQAGIQFTHFNNTRGKKIAEDMGSGAAWIDYNNDGWEDLFIVNYSAPVGATGNQLQNVSETSKLYRNNGNETFTDVSTEAGLDLRVRGMGTAWADYNNDGWIDCLVTTFGKNHLFRNNGNGTFTDVSNESNIGGIDGFWAGASWGDYNRDGFADLYITGYVDYFDIPMDESMADLQEPPSINPSVFDPTRNLLYKNNGDGTFTELAEEAGVANPEGRSLQSAWVDINDDMLPDLYVTNDVSDNMLYRNMGDGTFMNISYSAKIA